MPFHQPPGVGGSRIQIPFPQTGLPTLGSPNLGIFGGTAGGIACAALKLLGFECNLQGAGDAIKAGVAGLVASPGDEGCPADMVQLPGGGCSFPDSPADMSTMPGGGATLGVFGVPAVMPRIVGQRSNNRGEVVNIRQCPAATVLGKDNLCYAKGSIPRKLRKWPPARRAPVTAADAAHIRKAASAKARVKKLAGDVGFTCKKR